MKLKDYLTKVAARIPVYEAARRGWVKAVHPLTLTYSVTAACQSKCKTCHIGTTYLANPRIAKKNLALDEVEQVFKSLGPVYFFNISGGEPFMRPDLAEIVRLACIHLKPRLVHIPTNALAPTFIDKTTRKILAYMDEHLPASVPLSVKPSIDGVGPAHDFVRGIPGNFERLEQTIDVLLKIRADHPRLHVDLGTVISVFNLDHLDEIENWVHARGVESYRHEIAEQRAEFHNLGDPITPPVDIYEALVDRFKEKILRNIRGKSFLTRITEAVRLVYYDLAVQILNKRRQVTPCYAGISNIHLNYDGELWPCCVLGGEKSLGNVREWNCDVKNLLRSEQAARSRQYIARGYCACPLANQWLNNVLLTPRHMVQVLYTLLVRFRKKPKGAQDSQPVVTPKDQQETIPGSAPGVPRKALVMRKLGTIPEPEEVRLPVAEESKV